MEEDMLVTERIAELEVLLKNLLDRNAHWKSCQDGSYEMALDMSGYYKLKNELKALKESIENA
jgi:hypothetical protein